MGRGRDGVVVPRDRRDITESAILDDAAGRLADYEKPKVVDFVDDIPKTPYGKMDKKVLRDERWRQEDRCIG